MARARNGGGAGRALARESAALTAYFDDMLGTQPPEPRPASAQAAPCAPATAVEYLAFVADGLTLAIPRARAAGIVRCAVRARETADTAPPWLLGYFEHCGNAVAAVEIARILIPGAEAEGAAQFRTIVLLHGGRIGLVCDAVTGPLVIAADEVCWRSERTRRPWLAGTAAARGCAIFDIEALIALVRAAGIPAGTDSAL